MRPLCPLFHLLLQPFPSGGFSKYMSSVSPSGQNQNLLSTDYVLFQTFIPHLNYMIQFSISNSIFVLYSLGLSVILDYRNLNVELKTNVLCSVLQTFEGINYMLNAVLFMVQFVQLFIPRAKTNNLEHRAKRVSDLLKFTQIRQLNGRTRIESHFF